MSDSESTLPPSHAHPNLGGKSIESVQASQRREPYKSWRKKYRKMKHHFDGVLEENKSLFKQEHKLESLAKRLREELDGLLEICLDLNETPSIPANLRFNIRPKPRHQPPLPIDPNITPEDANAMVLEYKEAVSQGRIPPIDFHVVRDLMEQTLAAQGAEPLENLIASVQPQPTTSVDVGSLPPDIKGDEPASWMSGEQEAEYLLRLDAKLGVDPFSLTAEQKALLATEEEKHFALLTPREVERQVELANPQSQHNWLKTHTKALLTGEVDDNESLASHENPKPPRKRGGNKNLAKQVGDRAVERAREGGSPGAGSLAGEEDELSFIGEEGSARKKGRDPDSTYRVKGGRSGTGKGKRKRSGESVGAGGSAAGGSAKKAKIEGEAT